MRIAMFSETFLPGTDGVVTRLCATLRHLSELGHNVLLFAPSGAPETFASTRVVGVPSFRFWLYPEKKFALPLPGVAKRLDAFQPDLIHSVNPGFLSLAAIYYARRFHLPLIASYHTNIPSYARYYRLNWLEPFLWWGFRSIHNCAAINLCPSEATRSELEQRGFRNLALWERGIDLQQFTPDKRTERMRARLRHGRSDTSSILLYVGRLAAEKGIERLRTCLDHMPDVNLAIVGDGPYRAKLESIFAGSNTVFTGYLFGEELAEAYAAADGFVFTSTTETLGLVLYEAMASGVPVMAADSPATREVTENGRAGFIFNPLETESMMATIDELLNNQEKRLSVRARAMEIVSIMDWKNATQHLVHHYERLLAERNLVQIHPI